MVLETRAGLEAGVIGAGHRFAAMRLDAQRSSAAWAKEAMSGISYLGFIRSLAQRVDSEWDAVKVWDAGALCMQTCNLLPHLHITYLLPRQIAALFDPAFGTHAAA
jgi:Zn-dependent M16 (insulinase) family peptidase